MGNKMKHWFVRNDAIGNLQLASSSPAVWEEEVYFKLGAIPLQQTAAGQFTSSMNNAQTLGYEPASSACCHNGRTSLIGDGQQEE